MLYIPRKVHLCAGGAQKIGRASNPCAHGLQVTNQGIMFPLTSDWGMKLVDLLALQ